MSSVFVFYRGQNQGRQQMNMESAADDFMQSEIEFDLQLENGAIFQKITALISQPRGERFEETEIEVGRPNFAAVGYHGPWNQAEFQAWVQREVRREIGSGGNAINVTPGSGGFVMQGNTIRGYGSNEWYKISIDDVDTTAWRAPNS